MTLFEYISVATSLILSFSLARTLTNCFWILGAIGGLFVNNDHEVTSALFESLPG